MGNIRKKEVGAKGRRTKKKKNEKATTYNMSSKRKLSRLGKEQQKGKSGKAANFISRNQALKKLGITLRDFRRLCILKGIHPREPKIKNKGTTTTYYHAKDVSFLAHEPLLKKFREFKIFMKKIKRMAAKKNYKEAQDRYEDRPQYTLMHLVKERFPTFQSAIQDMDDALCMVHLFGQMKQHGSIGTERTNNCERFCREWQLIVVKTNALRKVFVTVKGFYYEAEIAGEPVVWLVPHMFPHQKPRDVDVRIMSTFLEFYDTFLKFVLFKLYHDAGLAYPPVIEEDADNAGSFLAALATKSLSATPSSDGDSTNNGSSKTKALALPAGLKLTRDSSDADAAVDEAEGNDDNAGETLEEEFAESAEAQELQQMRVAAKSFQSLFSGLRLFISRECPRDSLEFVIRAFRGQVGWEGPGSPFSADDPKITHQIVDRPSVMGIKVSSREYVQPQWVYDSINFKILVRAARVSDCLVCVVAWRDASFLWNLTLLSFNDVSFTTLMRAVACEKICGWYSLTSALVALHGRY